MIAGTVVNGLAVVAPALAGRAAYRMFAYAGARVRLRDSEAAVHAEAVVDPIIVNGNEVRTYRWGDGSRPVLLIHGWQSRASRFAAFIPRLRELGYTAVSFDAPGNGESGGRFTTAVDFAEAARQIQRRYGPFEAIVTHSFGSLCAFLAVRDGVRAGRLVTISGVADFGLLAGEFARQVGLSPRSRAALATRTGQLFGTELWRRLSARYRPEEIDLPTLVIHDQDDRVIDPGQAAVITEAFGSRVRRIVTSGLGHHRILGDPAVIDATLSFLTEPATPAAR